jgi:O-antigen ligase
VKIAVHHPIGGVGIGGFRQAYAHQQHLKGREPKKAASHDTPVTVAAETGVPGLLLFGWLLAAALLLTLRRVGAGFSERTRFVAGLALGAIAVHSLFYNAFFEDPMAWALFGLAALAATIRVEREPAA